MGTKNTKQEPSKVLIEKNESTDLNVRMSICELEIRNLKYQLQFICKPFIEKQRNAITGLSMDELIKNGTSQIKAKTKNQAKNHSVKFVKHLRRLLGGK